MPSLTCPACGRPSAPDASFCAGCGTLLTAAPVREERRTVTVLFADLAGFTSRAETMDPEDVRAFLHPWYDLLEHEVTGHGGVVERHLGDGIMALFGAPVAHEDDPERAVRAALRIAERLPSLGLDLHARLGINTGEVLFAASGPGREDAVTGDAVNTAARLQAAAPVDGVVVGEATYRASERLFIWEPMAPVAAKGKADPVPAWRALAPISRVSGELPDERTPFVGRDLELQTLVRLFERARTTPSLEVVTVVADPGIGKSRLVRELSRYVDALPELVTWRVGRCLPYGEGIGFWALSEIVKAQAGILDTDDQVTLGAKLDAAITEPDPSLRRWMTQRLAPLVGLETTAEPPQQEEAYTAWRRFLESIAQAGPLVLIVEDLHWADEALVGFLRHLADNTTGLPVFLVTTARPELEERHPGWLEHGGVLRLGPLPDADIAMLVAGSFPDASPELASTILDRAAGSPLYAEQLAAMSRDRPDHALDEAAIPATLQALLASRIDMLPPDGRAVLRAASVVGRAFWSGAVEALLEPRSVGVEQHLADLLKRNLVGLRPAPSLDGVREYSFVHALVRDVAYAGLSRGDRGDGHARAGAWFERTAPERVEDAAHHYATALELSRAAGRAELARTLEGPAVHTLRLAGERAAAVDPVAALTQLRRALDLASLDNPERGRILSLVSSAARLLGRFQEAAEASEAAIALFRSTDEALAEASELLTLGHLLYRLGDPKHEVPEDRALQLLEARGPSLDLVRAMNRMMNRHLFRGDLEEARFWADQAVAVSAKAGIRPPSVLIENRGVLRLLGGDEGGVKELRTSLSLALEGGDGWIVASSYCNVATFLHLFQGPTEPLDLYRRGIEWSESRGIRDGVLFNTISSTAPLFDLGRFDDSLAVASSIAHEAESTDDPGLAMAQHLHPVLVAAERGDSIDTASLDWLETELWGRGQDEHLLLSLSAAARGHEARGDAGQARRILERVAEIPHRKGDDAWASTLPRMVRTAIAAGDEHLASRLIEGFEPGTPYGRHAHLAAEAALSEAAGKTSVAAARYADAASRWHEFGGVPEEAYALVGLGRCLLALGETEEGVARLREARELWVGMKASPRIAEIDALLATVA